MRDLVSIFIPSLNGGGAERVMVTLANAIAARGFKVDLVLATAQGPYLKDVSESVRVVDLQAGRVIKALLPLVHYLRRERPVAMLSAMGHANAVALMARKLARLPVRVVVSERGLISGEHAIAQGAVAHLNYQLIRMLYPGADGICTVSQAASQDLAVFARLPLRRVQTIYNPISSNTHPLPALAQNLRHAGVRQAIAPWAYPAPQPWLARAHWHHLREPSAPNGHLPEFHQGHSDSWC